MLLAEQTCQLEHHRRGGAAVISTDEVVEALGVVVGAQEDHARFFTGNFHQDIFHREAAHGSVCAKGVRLDVAAIAFQFREKVILYLRNSR